MIKLSEVLEQKTEEITPQKYFPTGIKSFDKKFGGLTAGINLFAARPGMGLTSLSAQIVANISSKFKSLYITLDLTSSQLSERINNHVGINPCNIYLEDQLFTSKEILKFLTNLSSEFSMVIIDSFQFIDFDISYQLFIKKLSEISKDKAILLQYKLGRSVEERGGDKIPVISDLNDYNELKRACSNLYCLYRPGYYGITEDEYGRDIEDSVIIGDLNTLLNIEI